MAFDPQLNGNSPHQQLQWLRDIVYSMGDGVIACDAAGFVTFLNPVAAALTGWSEMEAAGARLETVFRIVNEQTRRPVESPVFRTLQEGTIHRILRDTLLIARDGTERPIEDSVAPIRGHSDEILGCVIVFRDSSVRRRMDAEREAARQELTTTLESITDGFARFDPAWRLVYMNAQAERLTGMRMAEVIGRTHWEIFPETVGSPLEASYRRAMAERVTLELEFFHGVWKRWFSIKCFPSPDGGLAIYFRDVTDLKETQRERLESEERYKFLDAIGKATQVTEEPGALLSIASRMLGEYLGVTRCAYADVESDSDSFTIRDDWRLPGVASTAGEYRLELFGSRAVTDLRQGRTLVINDVTKELTAADGREMFEAIGIRAIICCPLVKDGRLRAMMAVHSAEPRGWTEQEISLVREVAERSWAHIERVRSAAALARSEESYRTLFESIDEGYCVIEMIFDEAGQAVDYRFLQVNPAFEAQSGLKNAVGVRMLEFVASIEEHWLATYGRVARTGEPIRFENEYRSLNRWFDVYAYRLGGEGSCKVAVLFTDTTAKKLAELERERLLGELQAQDRQKNEFLAMLSHELRNPLAPIANAVQTLRLHGGTDPLQLEAHAVIERQVGQLKYLIDDLLEVSRITSGRVQLRRETVAVGGILSRAAETARPLIAKRRHEISIAVPPEPIWINADPARLEQVLVNLLANAAKYTEEGGRIWLSAEVDGETAVLRVRDTGVGIAPELQPHIFDLFTQGERSLARSEGGLGIGLALVKRMVELHGGKVEVASAPGDGSEFTIRLSVVHPNGAASLALPRNENDSGAGCRVLVVDDHVDSAESMARLLRLARHDVRTAHNGQDAIKAALQQRPEVVLLDIGLPEMDGYEVARELRQHPELQKAVLVALTGYGQESDRQQARESGFDHHLVKPADFTAIRTILVDAALRTKASS